MQIIPTNGMELPLHAVEEQCPMEYWVPKLKNFALSIIRKFHLPRFIGKKYNAEDFLEVLLLQSMMNISLDEGSDYLDAQAWIKLNVHYRRKKKPKQYKGKIPRKERLVPNGDQVRKYRNSLPMWMTKKLNEEIFDMQLSFALENGLINKHLSVIVDDNNEWYYGSDRYPDNQYINKSNKGPGTSRRRKYCAVMIRSKNTSLYVGVEIIKKRYSNEPFILKCIDRLILNGFHIDYVMGDRWFPTYNFISELNIRSTKYIGPYKKWPRIKKEVKDYLENGGEYIRKYYIKGAPAKFYHSPAIQTTIIFTNRHGKRLREIRADYFKDKTKLNERMAEIMVMITTFQPPPGKREQQGWAVGICNKYDRRWQIETGFKDLNRTSPPSNARTNDRKYLMRSVQYWTYNCWQIERAKRRLKRWKFKSWKRGPTLRHFSNMQVLQKIMVDNH